MKACTPLAQRDLFRIGGAIAIGAASGAVGSTQAEEIPTPPKPSYQIRTAKEALEKLLNGNKRYVADQQAVHPRRSGKRRQKVTPRQTPFAAILGCADSRVPPEILFDQGVGDLFVIRVAGHVLDASTLGSIEYAIAGVGVPLILVLGHENCGAVKAAVTMLENPQRVPEYFQPIAEKIRPAVKMSRGKPGNLLNNTIQSHVRLPVQELETVSSVLHRSIEKKSVKVIGAEYDLDQGKVFWVSSHE